MTDATLVSIEVLPAAPSIASGSTQQFTATGLYTDNSTQDLTAQVTWDSSDGAVATVSNAPAQGPRDGDRRRQHHRVRDQRRRERQGDVDRDRNAPSLDQFVAALLSCGHGRRDWDEPRDKVTAVQAALAVPDIVSACSAMISSSRMCRLERQGDSAWRPNWLADADAIKAAIPCP